MKNTLFLILCFFCFNAHAESFTMRCDGDDLSKEAVRIKSLAPNIVLRKNKTLMIRVAKKTIKYQDVPAEGLDNVQYRFCDRQNGYILIQAAEQMDWGGQLIVESTGEKQEAGDLLIFSKDHKAYFASSNIDGLDGNVWKVNFSDTGISSWEGYSFIVDPSKDGLYALAWLSDPKWTDRGELVATASCLNSEKHIPDHTVKLIKGKNGEWDWSPKNKCKK
jgi:hypothetical protein